MRRTYTAEAVAYRSTGRVSPLRRSCGLQLPHQKVVSLVRILVKALSTLANFYVQGQIERQTL